MKITKEMIDSQFFEELGIFEEELQMPTGVSQYMEYPPSGCKRRFVMQHHWRGASVHKDFRMEMNNHLVGWSVSFDSPVIIRREGLIEVVPIETVIKFNSEGTEIIPIFGIEVYGKNGFTKATKIARHKFSNDLLEITTRRGHIQVTPSHSLWRNDNPIEASSLLEHGKIDIGNLSCNQEIFNVPEDIAWLLGYFVADGYARKLDQWNCKISDQHRVNLEKVQNILSRYGVHSIIDKQDTNCWRISFPDWGKYIESLCYINSSNTSTHRRYKIVPKLILNAKDLAKKAFLEGFLFGDGPSLNVSKELALPQGILYLASCLGIHEFSYGKVKDTKIGWRHVANLSLKNRILRTPNEITNIVKVNRGRNCYVYDFETEDHSFIGGVGRIIAHNTILDNPSGTPEVKTMPEAVAQIGKLDWAFDFTKKNKGLRAETKARQPKEWLKVNGVVKPGEVGATKEETGVLDIIEHGVFWEGTQKPYFHEYFLKTEVGNFLPKGKWARVIFRGIQVPKIDPITKKPIRGQTEYMWKCMIPSNQIAYALQRGIKKGWKPPKGVIPIPPDQRSGELWDKWQAYMEGNVVEKAPIKESLRELEGLPFAEFKNFKDCVNKIMEKKGINEKRASAYCAVIWRQTGQLSFEEWCRLNYPDEYKEYQIGE